MFEASEKDDVSINFEMNVAKTSSFITINIQIEIV